MKQPLFLLIGMIALPTYAQGLSGAQTEVMQKLIASYARVAKAENAKAKNKANVFDGFSVSSGKDFYLTRRIWGAEGENLIDHEVSTCSQCHTDDPMKEGKHVKTKKAIKPLAPAANPDRFTNLGKVEKNFREHCMDIYKRDCTALEKGQILTYLMSVK